ncbi:MAG: trigger factor [Eubacteriales bacterium]|mgnify:CR=1 FL=1|nr:trigger factor [Eubacteriales bacterium]MDD4422291.1 trigger factor [Eubacteriales bacterium]HBR32075.1 trigger factor [Clostridiales bacterium]
MGLKSVKEIEKNRSELELAIDKTDFDAEVMRVYKKNVVKMNVPGFRKGKAPKGIIEKMYGSAVFYDEAIDNILPGLYESAIKESNLDVVSRPELEVVSIDENGVLLKAKVYTKPTAEVTKYKGLEVEKEKVVVTDEDITAEIDSVRKRNARKLTITDGAVENDDETVIDFEGFTDGVAFEGGKSEKYTLKIGSNSFIPGFEEQLIGRKAGEEFDITVTFPEDYNAENLAGKEAIFKIKLHEIFRSELPELDDEFVKDVSVLNTVEEYKADIQKKITERKEKVAENTLEENLIDELLANVNVDIPQPMIENEIDGAVKDYDYRLSSQGGSLDMYFKYTGMTMEQLRESFKDSSERQVKTRLALEKIVELEGIKPTDEELEEEYRKIASGYNIDIEKVKSSIPADGISADISLRKAVEFIKENAVIK